MGPFIRDQFDSEELNHVVYYEYSEFVHDVTLGGLQRPTQHTAVQLINHFQSQFLMRFEKSTHQFSQSHVQIVFFQVTFVNFLYVFFFQVLCFFFQLVIFLLSVLRVLHMFENLVRQILYF